MDGLSGAEKRTLTLGSKKAGSVRNPPEFRSEWLLLFLFFWFQDVSSITRFWIHILDDVINWETYGNMTCRGCHQPMG